MSVIWPNRRQDGQILLDPQGKIAYTPAPKKGLFITSPHHDRHHGREQEILKKRHRVYQEARRRNLSRWSRSIRGWEPVRIVRLNQENDTVRQAEELLTA